MLGGGGDRGTKQGPAGTSVGVRVRTTRGQTDMRGLVTAGRAVRLERPLVSKVERDYRAERVLGLLIARSRVTPRAAANDGTGRPFLLDSPDFNIKSLRVNAVFRWEFRPGSTAYVVWTQQREDEEGPGRLAFGPDLTSMFSAPGDNVLMVKVSYFLSR